MASTLPTRPDQTQLGRDFTGELHDGYRHLLRTINYRATAFMAMVARHGGVDAARLLLRGRDTHEGFTRLWQEKMLEHSVEAVVIKPEYAALFTDDERTVARQRLERHGFDVDGYLGRR
ncbi:MAG TPA: hypothetical protein VNP92_06935 [Actinophytocola sp.]|nr:hypothetical protein [Actinophytocola sp.]